MKKRRNFSLLLMLLTSWLSIVSAYADNVARIGAVEYASLAEAIAAVPDGTQTTITIIGDETIVGNVGVTIPKDKNVVLDLNGHTVNQIGPVAAAGYLIKNNGTLTIKDSSDTNKDGTGNGKMITSSQDPDTGDIPSYANNLISNYGNLSIESGFYQQLTETGYACYVVDNYSGATSNITGGKLTNVAPRTYVVRMFLTSTTATNTLNISGTAVLSGSYAVWMQYANNNANKANLNISGGRLEATDGMALYAGRAGNNVRNASEIEVSITGGYVGGTGALFRADTEFKSMTVSGGTFADFGMSVAGGNGILTGGTYESVSLFSEGRLESQCIIHEGYKCIKDGNVYKIVPSTDEGEAVNIYPDRTNQVYYYWLNSNGTKDGGFYDFYAPFEGPDAVLMDHEFIELLGNVTLTKDVEYLKECSFGDPIYAGGTFNLTFGTYDINLNGFAFPLPVGVSVITDKQTNIFTPEDASLYSIRETANSDGTYTYSAVHFVAQIGETKYASLAAAIAAVPTDGTQTTITMIADEVINVSGSALTIANNKNVVLELNGHQVVGSCSSGSSSALITNRGTLTIQDNTDTNCDGTGTGKMISGADPIWIHDGSDNYSGSYASNLVTNQGTLVIKSGYFENVSHGSATYAVDNQTSSKDVVLNVEGGKLTAVSCVVRMFCNSTTKQNVVNVSGGHIVTSGSTGIWTQLPQSSSSIKSLATLNVTGGEISGGKRAWYDYSFGASFESVNYSISGGELNGELLCNAYKNGIIGGFITGGTFSVNPSEYVAAGYAAAKVEAENVWKVGPVTVTDLTPQEGATETAAEYKATTVVTDEDDVQHEVGTNQTVFVAVVEENNVGEDVKLSDFKMDEVVTKAVVAANTEDDIDVQLIVKAAEPVVSDETVTFEVHPEAIITVNNGEPTNVELTNDDLAPNATFTFVLDVTGRFSNGATIKVVHKSEGYEDETFYSTVIDGKVTVSGITHFSDFELSVVGAVAQIGETEYASLADAFAAVKDGQTITMLIDVVLPAPLNVELAGKAVTLDLGTHTLTGRTNLKSGSLTLTNGNVAGGSQQALNVYGSSDSNATNYSVLTINSNVNVTADVYGVCLFGATASTNGYGAVVNINGTVTTTGDGESGAVFVSGNLGNGIEGDMHNVINIAGRVTSSTDAAVALNGNATVNVQNDAQITGNTGIAVKRGTLNVEGGTILGNGANNPNPAANGSGTEMTGAGISMSPTYSNLGSMSVNITGGTVNSSNAQALFKQAGTYQSDATFSVSGGLFSSEVPAGFCAEGYQPKYDEATHKYTVATFAEILADRDIVLIDGQSYETCVGQTLTQDVVVHSASYVRTVRDNFCAWYVPFNYTLTSSDINDINFYRINLIANAVAGTEVTSTDQIWVYLTRMEAGETLTANRPYVFKAKSGSWEQTFTTSGATLCAPATDSRLENSTTANRYDFYGTYATTTTLHDDASNHYFYVDYYGEMSWPGSYNVSVGPYRWYIKATQKGGGAYYAPSFIFTDNSDVTGISNDVEFKTVECYYDLKGRKIEKPAKGAYLVKFTDGSVRKVVK